MEVEQFESIDDIMYNESLHCDAYVYRGKPFDFIKERITAYSNRYTLNSLYDFSLDHFNWLRKNGVYHEGVRKSLMTTLRMVLETTGYEYDR